MQRKGIKVLAIALGAVMLLVTATGLSAQKRLKVVNVPKFTGFIFFELAKAGSEQACKELGCDLTYVGTTTADIEGQVQVYQNLVAQKPDVIVSAALDTNAAVPVLKRLRQQGTVIVSFDSDFAPAGRDLFVNQAPFEIQAKAMLESALANNPNGGKLIWLAAHPTTTNHLMQKKAIDELIAKNEKYKNMAFIDTLYMEDDPEKSYKVATDAMEAHPDLAGFVSGSGMAIPAVNKAIQDTGRIGKVYATGFALPSTMTTYLESGVCKQFPLWSPYWYGYMSTWLGIKIKRGEINVKNGVWVDIPNVGKRLIHDTPTGINTDLNMMAFFTKGHEDFDSAILMK